ncbi:hypothetical protein [Pseudomonas sp. RL_15y_Pfl2_60]|uniref:hypothetical protein n=1 Tax=Pseudomonas sp. RL_15y_Pfl2_60 TaxID=3088709 RepID=UPI0030DA4337
MSTRRPYNRRRRLERNLRAILSTNYVAVVNIDPSGKQGLINYKSAKSIAPGQAIADAVCDIPHHWVIYFSALCIDQAGQRYIKSSEVEPQGVYRADQITDVIETYYRQLVNECNQQHLVGSGWIANPCGASLDEEQAAKIYDAVGAWPTKEAA